MRSSSIRGGFTLVELLVVIAVIGILVGVLLPALAGARRSAQELQIAANLRTVGQAVQGYNAQTQFFPPAYVYASEETGTKWREEDQITNHPEPRNGYIHWSWALFDGDFQQEAEAFESPLVPDGGAPPTNPGPNPEDWVGTQRDDVGQTRDSGNEYPHDRQVDRIAFTGNAAVFPRNKLNVTLNGTSRTWLRDNQLVNPAWIRRPSETILATEFAPGLDWRTLKDTPEGDTNPFAVIKSHRPVTPFILGGNAGGLTNHNDIYKQNPQRRVRPYFYYPFKSALSTVPAKTYVNGQGQAGLIVDEQTGLNAVARMHPGGDELGGSTYFLYIDGAV